MFRKYCQYTKIIVLPTKLFICTDPSVKFECWCSIEWRSYIDSIFDTYNPTIFVCEDHNCSYVCSQLHSLPWNQETLLGYFAEMVFYIYTAGTFFIAMAMLLLPFISICWHHQAFYKVFRHSLRQMDSPDAVEGQDNEEQLVRLIRFHATIKEWVHLFENNSKILI